MIGFFESLGLNANCLYSSLKDGTMTKFLYLLLFSVTTHLSLQAQTIAPSPGDVNSMENILTALYDVISGPAGEKRDWDRMRSLFAPEAKLIPTGKNAQGQISYRMWSVEEYISQAGSNLEKNGFFENEVHRVVEHFGTITHVFSTYESRRKADDPEPFVRGINSIQLMHDDNRWWIVNIMWMGENDTNPIPGKYLGN